MSWYYFNMVATLAGVNLFVGGSSIYFIKNEQTAKRVSNLCFSIAILLIGSFIGWLWYNLERPPMRTLGETRLLYTFFMPIIGLLTYKRWNYKWILSYSALMALVFLLINVLKPETHDKSLMPALVSPWFVPHVVVYIFAYAMLAASALVAAQSLWINYYKNPSSALLQNYSKMADNIVYVGYAFLTLGLLFGALWAKEAWGHYWTWDPKETWAFISWVSYLIYIHLRYKHPHNHKTAMWALAIAFVMLLICWFGINYLPVSNQSVHTYSN